MEKKKIATIIANFGGPRNLPEVTPFLEALLTDQDVVRTKLPSPFHRFLFSRIARIRGKKVADNYKKIGGRSPIFTNTEAVRDCLESCLEGPVLTFHRYLTATHKGFLRSINDLNCDEIHVFPMFPQFTYATTGSVARWFQKHLPPTVINKMRWVKSYPAHPSFILAHKNNIRNFMKTHQIEEAKTVLLFSAHGIPMKFIASGDIYQKECEATFDAITQAFPNAKSQLCYQSKFGPGAWLRPYTKDVCQNILSCSEGRSNVVFVPISFTSDHFETLFEIENEYIPLIKEKNLSPYRIPALSLNPDWIQTICSILKEAHFCNNQALIWI